MHARSTESTQTVLLVRSRKGYHLALIPGDMDGNEVEAAFHELKISPLQVCEIRRWRKSEGGLAVTNLPSPPMN